MQVIKRDHSKEEFDINKIKNAVTKAFKAVDEEVPKELLDKIDKTEFPDNTSVEDIQDIVEDYLMDIDHTAAKAFILYREQHKNIRNFVASKEAFISKFKQSSNTANATIDDNSNVGTKNIGVLNAEIHKEDNREINRGMVTNKLKELFPDFDYKQYRRDLEHHIIYKHDESSMSGAIAPYTYSPKEVVTAKYGNHTWLVALDTLYDLVDCEESCLDFDNQVYAKFPEELYILDRNGFTLVTRLIKKRRHRDLVRVKTVFGEDIVVTDNHPLIVSEDINQIMQASDAEGQKQLRVPFPVAFGDRRTLDLTTVVPYTVRYSNFFLQQNEAHTPYFSCKRHIELNEKFGYVVGFFVGDGHYDNGRQTLSFTQKEKETLERIAEFLYDSCGVPSTIEYKKDKAKCWRMYVQSKALFELFHNYFKIKDYAQNKNIPINVMEFNKDFAKGIIEGLIDADGNVCNNNGGIQIRLASRECIHQLTSLLKIFNFKVANTVQNLPFSNNTLYKTNYTIWGVSFNNVEGCEPLNLSYKWHRNINRVISSGIKYSEGWVNIDSVTKLEDSAFMQQCDYIYDVTTESHTFVTSNILVHNCCSISMYPFLLNGLKDIGGLSAAPKNLDSFCGLYINLIFAVSAQFLGAVATSEVLLYFDYFCRKEWGDNYWQKPDMVITNEFDLRKMTIQKKIHQYFQQIIYSINQPAAARGLQSAFVNWSYFDHPFFDSMFGNFIFPDGSKPIWESLNWLQRDFMEWFNEERLKCILTFPVESFALIYKDGHFVDQDSADFVAKMYSKGHSFFTYISDTADSLSSCCRLKNKLTTHEFNFTNGNMGVETGSKSVITLNLSRIIQDWAKTECSEEDKLAPNPNKIIGERDMRIASDVFEIKMPNGCIKFKNIEGLKIYLNEILERVYKYHIAYNECLWDMYDANLLPVYKAGFISLNKQYLTIGINGLNAAAEYLGIKCTNNELYQDFCEFIFSTIKDFNTKHNGKFNGHKITLNTECVPAESLAVKNYNWDKEDGYWINPDDTLYASYIFKPNDEDISVLDKFILHGRNYIGDFLDGGAACHVNLDHHLDEEQYKKLLKFAADNGCQYFTFNIPNCQCEECGFITKHPISKCPKCGSTHISWYDRIIGYLTKIKNWSDGRRLEKRVYTGEKEDLIRDKDKVTIKEK